MVARCERARGRLTDVFQSARRSGFVVFVVRFNVPLVSWLCASRSPVPDVSDGGDTIRYDIGTIAFHNNIALRIRYFTTYLTVVFFFHSRLLFSIYYFVLPRCRFAVSIRVYYFVRGPELLSSND